MREKINIIIIFDFTSFDKLKIGWAAYEACSRKLNLGIISAYASRQIKTKNLREASICYHAFTLYFILIRRTAVTILGTF